MRTPVFELHILPMMRASDREHMAFAFDLWNYDDVAGHVNEIAQRAAVDMPTAATGGPWPEEWVALLRRWRDTGFKRLQLATATYTLSAAGSKLVLTATGDRPSTSHRVWLQLDGETQDARTYLLYVEAPDGGIANAIAPFSVRERYPATDTRAVIVRDAIGAHEVPLTPASPAVALAAGATDREFWRLDDDQN